MTVHPFVASLVGGMLIGTAAAILFVFAHRIAGVSGVLGGLLEGGDDRGYRLAFVGGLVATGALLGATLPGIFGPPQASLARVVAGGLLVGFGTRLGNGCTSGHGVCGISRLSPRSMLATATFVGVAMATVAIFRLVAGVAP